jgi:hypothetical protein
MIPEDAINDSLEAVPEGNYDRMLVEALLKTQGDPDLNSLIRRRSAQLTTKLADFATVLAEGRKASAQISGRLRQQAIIWLPRQRSYLFACRLQNDYIIGISNGFLDMINLTVQSILMDKILWRKLELQPSSQAELEAQIRETSQMFFRIFRRHEEGNNPVFLPELFNKMSARFQVAAFTLVSAIRLFAILHEIGHIELGHLTQWRGWIPWPRRSIRMEDLPMREPSNRSKRFEYEADVFAVRQGPDVLLPAAEIFFFILGVIHSTHGYVGLTHPHAANRLASLYQEFPPPGGQSLYGFMKLNHLSEGMPSPYDFGADVSLEDERRKHPRAPTEVLEIFWFLSRADSLFNEVKQRPSDFPNLFQDAIS